MWIERGSRGLIAAVGLTLADAQAQEVTSANPAAADVSAAAELLKLAAGSVDLAVPTSPAFTILNVTPETVVRPETPRALAAGLLEGLDPNGNLQTGVAVDTAPYLLFFGNDKSLDDYRSLKGEPFRNYGTRLAARTQFSLATTKGASDDDEALRVALGLRVTPWDRGDPRNDEVLPRCFADSLALRGPRESLDELLSGDDEERLERNRMAVQNCRAGRRPVIWNESSWSLGLAPTWTGESGAVDDLEWSGIGLWTSLAYGFEEVSGLEDALQVLFHARHRTKEVVPDPDSEGNFLEQDTLTLGTQLRFAGPNIGNNIGGPDLNFLVDIAFINEDRDDGDNQDKLRYTLGSEVKLTDNMYLQLTLGSESGGENDDSFILGRIAWGLAESPALAFGSSE